MVVIGGGVDIGESLVVTVLVASYWRGGWYVQDFHGCAAPLAFCSADAAEHKASGAASEVLGLALTLGALALRHRLASCVACVGTKSSRGATIGSYVALLHTLTLGWASISLWRGCWYLLDAWVLPSDAVASAWASHVGGTLVLVLLGALASSMAAPAAFLVDGGAAAAPAGSGPVGQDASAVRRWLRSAVLLDFARMPPLLLATRRVAAGGTAPMLAASPAPGADSGCTAEGSVHSNAPIAAAGTPAIPTAMLAAALSAGTDAASGNGSSGSSGGGSGNGRGRGGDGSGGCGSSVLLAAGDILLSVGLVAHAVVSYWRGLWLLFDHYEWRFSADPVDLCRTAWVSTSIGVGVCALEVLRTRRDWWLAAGGKGHKALLLLRTYVLAFGSVNTWRGVWYLWDAYDGVTLASAWVSHWVGLSGLLVLGASRSVLAAPTVLVLDDTTTAMSVPTAPTVGLARAAAAATLADRPPRPIVFLDIDGVLNSTASRAEGDHNIAPPLLANLQHIVATTGAEIVLSSTWRLVAPLQQQVRETLWTQGISSAGPAD